METISIERDIWINAPRERVWKAITTPEQMKHWWGSDHWEFSALEAGGIVTFGDPNDLMTATIDVCEPPTQFSIKWPPQTQFHSIALYTSFFLTEEDGGTRVRVLETGYEGLPAENRQEPYEKSVVGYEMVLAALKSYLERE